MGLVLRCAQRKPKEKWPRFRPLSQMASGQAPLPDQLAAFGIAGGMAEGLKRLFLSHPPLEQRIAALEADSAVSRR